MSSTPYASSYRSTTGTPEGPSPMFAVASVLLGLLVVVLAFVAVFMWVDAHQARDDANRAAARVTSASPGGATATHDMAGTSTSLGDLTSYAGAAPANAMDVAMKHAAYPAQLPAVPAGPVARYDLVLKDITVQIAPGIKYAAWAWAGGAPGPIIHVRQGQTVDITLTNKGAIPHSIDFHAARVAPNVYFKDVNPGSSFHFRFKANDPGVFMYHCGTKPVLMHIANGMYGAIVVDPKPGVLPKADRSYVLVASEWYLDSNGLNKAAQYNMTKAHARQPDWMTFNGYSGQYVTHPLTADPGQTVRFYVVDAGPSIDTDFHIVGTILNRAWVDAGVTSAPLKNVQTVAVPAGGGGVFDVKIDKPGLYPFVSHAFAAVDQGQVGLLNVGNVKGSLSH
jgi:nitrite reductase (NO-forming)